MLTTNDVCVDFAKIAWTHFSGRCNQHNEVRVVPRRRLMEAINVLVPEMVRKAGTFTVEDFSSEEAESWREILAANPEGVGGDAYQLDDDWLEPVSWPTKEEAHDPQ